MKNQNYLRYFKNTSWMMVDSLAKIFVSFTAAILVARYLGPTEYGALTFVVSLVFLFMPLARMGMETILVREFLVNTESRQEVHGAAFWLMLLGAIFSSIILISYVVLSGGERELSLSIVLMSVALLLQPFYTIDYNFQSMVKAKISAKAKILSYLLGLLFKIYLVYSNSSLIWFVFAFVFDYMLLALFLYIVHVKNTQYKNIFIVHRSWIAFLVKSSKPLVISSFTMSLYVAADKVAVKHFLGFETLGVYSAALKFYEGYLFVPVILGTSLLPPLFKLKERAENEYLLGFERIYLLVVFVGLCGGIVVTFFGGSILAITFGAGYVDSASAFSIIIWATVFIGMGTISNTYFTIERMESKLVSRTLLACFLNIFLNISLIPFYGMEGASFSTLISAFISYYLIDVFDKSTRNLFLVKTNALTMGLSRTITERFIVK